MTSDYTKALARTVASEATTSIREMEFTPTQQDIIELAYWFRAYLEADFTPDGE